MSHELFEPFPDIRNVKSKRRQILKNKTITILKKKLTKF